MTNAKRPSFVRLFASGFVLGAAGLIAVQASQADATDLSPTAAAVMGAIKG